MMRCTVHGRSMRYMVAAAAGTKPAKNRCAGRSSRSQLMSSTRPRRTRATRQDVATTARMLSTMCWYTALRHMLLLFETLRLVMLGYVCAVV